MIRLLLKFFVSLLLVIPCFMSSLAKADLTPITVRDGRVASTYIDDNIRMESQLVSIKVGRDCYLVDASFRFFNTGETTTKWVGHLVSPNNPNLTYQIAADNLEAWVDGERSVFLKTSGCGSQLDENTGPPARWIIKEITFPKNAVTTVRLVYESPFNEYASGQYSDGQSGNWKGNVEKVVFIIDTGEVPENKNVKISFPSKGDYRELTKKVTRYEIRDIKPAQRISEWKIYIRLLR